MGLLTTPNEPAPNPSGASSQPLGSKLPEGVGLAEFFLSVDKPFCYPSKLFYSPVSEEGPPAADILTSLHVDVHNLHHLFVFWSPIEEFSLRPGYEAAAPERYSVGPEGSGSCPVLLTVMTGSPLATA